MSKAEAAVHAVCSQLEGLLADVVLQKQILGQFVVNELLHFAAAVHQFSDLGRQDACWQGRVGQVRKHFFINSRSLALVAFGFAFDASVHRREANIELLLTTTII